LADFDLNCGLVSFLLGLDPKYSVIDAINNVDRLDRNCWDKIVAQGAGGLQIIAAPGMLANEEMTAGDLTKTLNLIRAFYQWIVVDFGRLNRTWRSLVDTVDELLLVTTRALPALHETKRVIDCLVDGGMDRERLRLIVNQTEGVQRLSGNELKQLFGIRVYATLPNDSEELHQACLQKKLPGNTSNVGRQMVNLARKLAGLNEVRAKKNLPDFLSFVERFRKTGGSASEQTH